MSHFKFCITVWDNWIYSNLSEVTLLLMTQPPSLLGVYMGTHTQGETGQSKHQIVAPIQLVCHCSLHPSPGYNEKEQQQCLSLSTKAGPTTNKYHKYILIGVSLSKPHTSRIALHMHVCICMIVCLQPYTHES